MAKRSGEGLLSTPEERKKGEAMNNATSILEQVRRRVGAAGKGGAMVRGVRGKVMWANTIRRGVCVLVLVLLFLTAGVGVRADRDVSTAEATVAPTGTIVPTTTLSPDSNGRSKDMAQVTLSARFKTH
jgi:hypothetical protein